MQLCGEIHLAFWIMRLSRSGMFFFPASENEQTELYSVSVKPMHKILKFIIFVRVN